MLHHAAYPNGRPTAILGIRLTAVTKSPVEVILTGKLAVARFDRGGRVSRSRVRERARLRTPGPGHRSGRAQAIRQDAAARTA